MYTSDYLDLSQCPYAEALDLANITQPWDILPKIAPYLTAAFSAQPPRIEGINSAQRFPEAQVSEHAHIGDQVFIGQDTVVEAGATIQGPAIIGTGCVIRAGAYLRQNVLVGDHATLGNSCEFKNCLLFNHAEVPHFNYVGDAVLGHKAHLGAGVVLSNVRLDREPVKVQTPEGPVDTGLKKFSAIIGDQAEIGCNSVISPGTLIGRKCVVYPCAHFSGVLKEKSMLKVRQGQQVVEIV